MIKRYVYRRILIQIVFVFSIITSPAIINSALPVIKYPVNDYAGVISPRYRAIISKLIVNHRKNTGVQIAVLTVYSTGDRRIEDYSMGVAEQWGGGSSERDDGMLFVIAINDRKMRLEVGYGLEGYIPDIRARAILNSIKTDFRSNRYGQGIYKVINNVIKETESLSANNPIPIYGRVKGFIYHFSEIHWVLFLLSGIIGALFILFKEISKPHKAVSIIIFILLWAAIPFVLQLFFPGVWYWRPIIYVTGACAGGSIVAPFFKKKLIMTGRIVFFVIALIIASVSLGFIIYNLDILKPDPFGTTMNESIVLSILFFTNIFQGMLFLFMLGNMTGGGSTYRSSGSSYSSGSSSYSSSSSSSSSWSGGGGSFGGGGASSSW